MSYLLTIFILGMIILVHEWGHYLMAAWTRIPISTFSIGFGPKLWSFQRGETEYRLSAIPLGGYVLPAIQDEEEFFLLPVKKRMIMTLGGPLANLILAYFCLSVMNIIKHELSIYQALLRPFEQIYIILTAMLQAIVSLFEKSNELSGIIGIVSDGGNFISNGRITDILFFACLISLNLALLNMLPLPVLDGGKLLLYLLEMIHPSMKKLHIPAVLAGWVLLIGLTIYATIQDVIRLT